MDAWRVIDPMRAWAATVRRLRRGIDPMHAWAETVRLLRRGIDQRATCALAVLLLVLGIGARAVADECPAPWQGLDVQRTTRELVVPEEPWVGALEGSGCVGVVVVPAQPIELRARLISRDGRTWHEAWARPFAFVRGCGDGPRVVIETSRSVAVTVVELRDPPPELPDAACRARRPGVESRPPSLGPEPPAEEVALPPVEAPWTRDTELALPIARRVDLGMRAGCVRVDVAGAVQGGRVVVAGRAFALWSAPYGAWAAVCADGATVLELEGDGPLAVRVSRAATSTWSVGGPEAAGLRTVARGAATEAPPTQTYLRTGTTWRWPAREDVAGCRRAVAVGADEASEARFELRALGPDDALLARGRGGPGRAARVDACVPVSVWELVQLGPSGRIVVEEASW